jgi:hypothetical protein
VVLLLAASAIALVQGQGQAAAAEVCIGPECDTAAFVDDSGRFYIYEDLVGTADVGVFYFGDPGDVPLAGDWDCDGEQTPAAYRRSDGFVYLRNSNSQGVAETSFHFGDPGDIPIVGDFDGDGCDTISVYRPAEGRVYVHNALEPGPADFFYYFGDPGDVPFAGDFDGDGVDTIGLHRRSTGLVYFRDTHTPGVADREFIFGDPGDEIIAGDWDGDDVSTVAAYRPGNGVFYVTNRHEAGIAEHEVFVGRFRHAVRIEGIDEIADALIESFQATQPSPIGIPGNWDLFFEDPFDVFDERVWQPRYQWTPTVINDELQAYLPSAVSVHDGRLHLTATATPANAQPYTSGVITSYDKFSFLYGAVEFRAKAPAGNGLLSALWMLPANHGYPPEIDVIEINGGKPHQGHFGYHWPNGNGIGSDRSTSILRDQSGAFHTYAITWDPGLVVWYVDGFEVHRYQGPEVVTQEMYLLANLSIGGWVGSPDVSTPLPAEFEIDYIRVWQRR